MSYLKALLTCMIYILLSIFELQLNLIKPSSSTSLCMKFGTLMRKQRETNRLSQQEIADALGVSQSTYCNWESDRSAPRSRHFPKLIKLLDINPAQLMPELVIHQPANEIETHLRQELHQYQLLVSLLERDLEQCQQRNKELEDQNIQLQRGLPTNNQFSDGNIT